MKREIPSMPKIYHATLGLVGFIADSIHDRGRKGVVIADWQNRSFIAGAHIDIPYMVLFVPVQVLLLLVLYFWRRL
jgi:hypothetical protein